MPAFSLFFSQYFHPRFWRRNHNNFVNTQTIRPRHRCDLDQLTSLEFAYFAVFNCRFAKGNQRYFDVTELPLARILIGKLHEHIETECSVSVWTERSEYFPCRQSLQLIRASLFTYPNKPV